MMHSTAIVLPDAYLRERLFTEQHLPVTSLVSRRVLTGSRTALCGGKSEELCEDIRPNIGHCQRLLANGVVFALDRSVRDSAFVTFQDGQQSLVAPIDIIAQLKLTVFVDKGGLIGHVDRYENWQANFNLRVAKHAADTVLGPLCISPSSGTARLSAAIKMTTAPATTKGNNARAVNGRPAHA